MKPVRNRVFCPAAQRQKMVFESKEKADLFLSYHIDGMSSRSVYPVRSYHCVSCGGWHITHLPLSDHLKEKDRIQSAVSYLSELVDGLKHRFTVSDWERWSERIEGSVLHLELLSPLPEHLLFCNECERQISHYQTIISRQRRKASAVEHSESVERIHALHQEIFHHLSSRDFDSCLPLGEELLPLVTACGEALSERKRRNYLLLGECLTFPEHVFVFRTAYHLLRGMDDRLVAGLPVPSSDCENLSQLISSLSATVPCNEIIAPLRTGLEKIRRRQAVPLLSAEKCPGQG